MNRIIITFNQNIKSDFVLEETTKTELWKTYQDIFNHLKYEDADYFVFTNEEIYTDGPIIIDNNFQWIDIDSLQFICTKKFVETLNINKISKLRWKPSRNEHRSSGVEIILENHRISLDGK